MSTAYDVLVLGAGPAGTAAAVRAAELGAAVAVVEAGRVGGTCVNTGCVPTRVLAKTARIMRDIRSAHEAGIDVAEPQVAWPRVVTRVRRVIENLQAVKQTPESFAAAGADLYMEGRGWFLDPHLVELESGTRLEAGAVVVCVGGHSRLLPIDGAHLALTVERVLDLPELPRAVAIVGSGSTGAQLATIFCAFGCLVTLLELAPRVMPGVDEGISEVLAASFAASGIEVVTGIDGVTAIGQRSDGGRTLTYEAGRQQVALDVGAVLLSVGWPAAIEGLGLEAAGVRVDRGRVPVNAFLQTNVPHVYVPGDANGDAMLVQAARFEAEAAATNAVLGPTHSVSHALLPFGGFTDPDYAGVGLTEAEARERDPQCLVAVVPYAEMERAVIDGRTTGFCKLIADRRRSLLLGAHAVGESAVEVIQAVTTAMAAGVDVATLARVEFAYPTYTAIVGQAAGQLLAEPAQARTRARPPAPGRNG